MKASEIIDRLTTLMKEFGDKDVVALGELACKIVDANQTSPDEFFEIEFIASEGNEEKTAPYILALKRV